jgi:hypothetical protein
VNFSIWTTYAADDANHALKECVEKIKKKHMPLKSFTWMHSEAKLTDEERQEMVAWFDGQRR